MLHIERYRSRLRILIAAATLALASLFGTGAALANPPGDDYPIEDCDPNPGGTGCLCEYAPPSSSAECNPGTGHWKG